MAGLFANVTILAVLLLVAGLVLMIVEMCVPGFGIFGILGIICFVGAIVVTAKSVAQAVIMASGSILVLAVVFIIFLILASQGIAPQKLILKDQTNAKSGFVGATVTNDLIGKSGVTITALRPAGCIECEGERIDVVTKGDYIDKGVAVTIKEVDGNRVIVVADQ